MAKKKEWNEMLYGNEDQIEGQISKEIDKNIKIMEALFEGAGDIVKKEFSFGEICNAYVLYVDGLANSQMVEDFVLRPMKQVNQDMLALEHKTGELEITYDTKENKRVWNEFDSKKKLVESKLELVDYLWKNTLEDTVVELLAGNTVFLIDGIGEALVVSSKFFPTRGVGEVESEKTLRGSKDAFTENLRTNTALIRRRIRDGRMKVDQRMIGTRSHTHIAICYVDGLVRKEWLNALYEKLEQYEIDAIYDSGMLEQMIEPSWQSPFPQFQYTERPDKASSAILEGRIALVVDNSPDVLLLPATANTFFQASDDYYSRHFVAQFARALRYLAAILAVGLPGLYLSVISYHTELLPVQLILTIAKARQEIPFPAVVEILLMELEFELLREAGIRLPGQMGNTIGVVGGLIVGQAAVEAGLVSTIVVIVVALTAIASFAIPSESFSSAFRLLKFFLIFLCAFWGIYGFFIGMIVLFIHLSSLESFGLPYLMPAVSSGDAAYDDVKDFILKKPIFSMIKRPVFARREQQLRMKKKENRS